MANLMIMMLPSPRVQYYEHPTYEEMQAAIITYTN